MSDQPPRAGNDQEEGERMADSNEYWRPKVIPDPEPVPARTPPVQPPES